jgi:uncharacterized protein YbaP (TraB family)
MRRPTAKLFFFTCALALANFAPPGASRAYAQATAGAFDKGLLWRVEKPGIAPSYLFGTVHLADKRVTALPDAVRKELDAARSFTMEVSLDQANVMALAARMLYTDGRDLPDVAGADLYRRVVPLTQELGLPAEVARMFKPWAMVLMLQMPQQQTEDVLDATLHRIASQQGKALSYLETVDEQVAAFENMTDAEQVALLGLAVETHAGLKAATENLVLAYLQRDLGLMWQIGEADVAQRPELKPLKAVFDQRLLFDRNTRMIDRMQPQLKSGQAFVAVGALHLYGERGLLSLLARDGYRVSRVY